MPAQQRKISQFMLKTLFIEAHDICNPAQVICMALSAIGATRQPAVESFVLIEVGCDFFMAIKTQAYLSALTKRAVTLRTLTPKVLMCFDQLPGHQQCP